MTRLEEILVEVLPGVYPLNKDLVERTASRIQALTKEVIGQNETEQKTDDVQEIDASQFAAETCNELKSEQSTRASKLGMLK